MRGRARLVVGGIGLLVGSMGLILRGAFAGFTTTANGSNADNSADMVLSLPTPGATNRISVPYTSLHPGDNVYRAFDLTAGSGLDTLVLTTIAAVSSPLDTDNTNGLKMQIDKCPGSAWTEAGVSPNYTYTCPGGGVLAVLAQHSIIGTKMALSNVSNSATSHLLLTVTLPTASPTTMQSAHSEIQYKFQAGQRGAAPQ